ncbi:septum site-determining protein MinC [Catenovulum sp. 2E275]|uniref:septum site-determining protein MinC n=1 Tax=Catenovulum sp. 2E275 TaxID=2980497 RepID=UPI0021CE2E1E|nr:septum site-determining protein MinC [Catenovulum sp. 2E275]MCU4675751.1 septum site-determining protein MinC [Catenovulum sp. 2E275]
MSESKIELKGSSFTLSVLHIQNGDVAEIIQALSAKIQQAPSFFKMAPIVINIAQLGDDLELDFSALKQQIEALELVAVGVSGATEQQKIAAKAAGLACLTESKSSAPQTKTSADGKTQVRYERVEVPVEVKVPSYMPAKIVRQNLRSGQQIYARDTDLVIIGAVSHGAEVIADGNIHVYGSLRGRAIAGAQGDSSARIFANKLEAELVSINGHYWTSEQLQQQSCDGAGFVFLDGEQLAVSDLEI